MQLLGGATTAGLVSLGNKVFSGANVGFAVMGFDLIYRGAGGGVEFSGRGVQDVGLGLPDGGIFFYKAAGAIGRVNEDTRLLVVDKDAEANIIIFHRTSFH